MRFIPIATTRLQTLVNEFELMKGDVRGLMGDRPLTVNQQACTLGFAIIAQGVEGLLGDPEAQENMDDVEVAMSDFTERYQEILGVFKEQLDKEVKQ